MFKRQYQYVCSSDRCLSKFFETESLEDFVNAMTLYEPKEGLGLGLEGSIKEWESGSSEHAICSCKELFNQEPDYSEYISEIDHGTSIVTCSGWRNVSNIVFFQLSTISCI